MINNDYIEWIRHQPCCFSGLPAPSDPHHCGDFGTAKRNHDEKCVPLNRKYHTPEITTKYAEWFRKQADKYYYQWKMEKL